jgi:drug/metabolite transporter (DMT)-like permease
VGAIAQPALTASTSASILLALLGALLFAVSAALQHHVVGVHARQLTSVAHPAIELGDPGGGLGDPADLGPTGESPSSAFIVQERDHAAPAAGPVRRRLRVLALLRRLARDPMWLLGWVTNLAGFAAQAAALHLGSIVIVQALLVTQLLFALPLSALPARRRPLRRDWLGTAAVCAGLATLLTVRGAVPQTTGRRSDVWIVVCVAAGLILLLLLVSRVATGQQYRTAAIGAAAGICFCLTAVFLVLIGDDVARGGAPAAVTDWPVPGLCASTLLGLVLVQRAFAAGTLPAAMTAMVVTDPVCSWIAGTVLFDAGPRWGAGVLAGSALGVGLIALGVAALANSPTLRDESRSAATQPVPAQRQIVEPQRVEPR